MTESNNNQDFRDRLRKELERANWEIVATIGTMEVSRAKVKELEFVKGGARLHIVHGNHRPQTVKLAEPPKDRLETELSTHGADDRLEKTLSLIASGDTRGHSADCQSVDPRGAFAICNCGYAERVEKAYIRGT